MSFRKLNRSKDSRKLGTRECEQYFDCMGEYLTVSEFCEYFNVPKQTVSRWLREGQLPGIKLGKKWRISKVTVEKLEAGELKIEETGSGSDSDDSDE